MLILGSQYFVILAERDLASTTLECDYFSKVHQTPISICLPSLSRASSTPASWKFPIMNRLKEYIAKERALIDIHGRYSSMLVEFVKRDCAGHKVFRRPRSLVCIMIASIVPKKHLSCLLQADSAHCPVSSRTASPVSASTASDPKS